MTQTQLTTIRVKAAKAAHRTMDSYTGKDLAELKAARHNAAVKAWATRNAKAGKKVVVKASKAVKAVAVKAVSSKKS